jgi:hypothetical protein
MFGQAWDNIRQDPWGDLAAAGVIALGVGLMFVPGGQVIGTGILLGAATSAGIGLVTGNLNPRMIAISGIAGGIGAGVGAAATALLPTTSSALAAGVSGMASTTSDDLVRQELTHPGHLDLGDVGYSAATGGLGNAGSSVLRRTLAAATGPASNLAANAGRPAFEIHPRVLGQLDDPRLGALRGKLTPDDLQDLAHIPSARYLMDTATGNINVIQDVDGVILRITTPRDAFKIISVGRMRPNQIPNGLESGRFVPIGSGG